MALTFDDLPFFGKTVPTAEAAITIHKLLIKLHHSHYRATGFVNEIKLEGTDRVARTQLLNDWLNAGMDLGNHSYSHLSLTNTPVEAMIADVARGEVVTRGLLARRGRLPRWYRPPYLQTGQTLEVRQQFEGWLADHGYRVAPVTMENSDWVFALPYDDARARGDTKEAQRIMDAYVAYSALIVPWYQHAAHELLGRTPDFVFLLHASRLNADCFDQVAAILKERHLRGVTLDRAMRDPAYKIPDDYAGPQGDQWLTRWARTLHKEMPWATLPHPPPDIIAIDARLEALPH